MAWQKGTVRFFDKKKQFGFIVPSKPGEDVFFHRDEGVGFGVSGTTVVINRGAKISRVPETGDEIIFESERGEKGPRAIRWGYLESYRASANQAKAG